jgi:hypothetical protein
MKQRTRGGLTAFVLTLLTGTHAAHAQHHVAVDFNCCDVREVVNVPLEGMGRIPPGQIGAVTVNCRQFFGGAIVGWGGGFPRSDGKREVDLSTFPDTAAVKEKVCKALRDKGTHCCAASGICPDNCAGILRADTTAATLFQKIYVGLADGSHETAANKIAVSRFLSNCESSRLLNDLVNMPCPRHWRSPQPGCKLGDYIKIKLLFRDRNLADAEAGSTSPGRPFPDPSPDGESDPQAVKNFVYTISITHQTDIDPSYRSAFPAPDNQCFAYSYKDGSSAMAATLYHELLHIWWMNNEKLSQDNFGHGIDLYKCSNYERPFAQLLGDFSRVMDNLERCIKAPESNGSPAPR